MTQFFSLTIVMLDLIRHLEDQILAIWNRIENVCNANFRKIIKKE